MKKLYTLLTLLIVLVVLSSCSATKRMARKEPLKIVPEKLNLAVNTNNDPYVIPVEYTVLLPKRYVTTRSQLRLVPYFANGDKQAYLTPVYIDGKAFSKLERRCERFKNPIASYGDGIQVVSGRNPETITVKQNVPFELWMTNAKLKMATLVNVCKEETLIDTRTLANGVYYMPVNLGPELPPPAPTVKIDKAELALMLYFPVNVYKIDPELFDNAKHLALLKDFLERSMKDTTINITGISLLGIASPEGSFEHNRTLAQQRAQSVKEYIDNMMPEVAKFTKVDFLAENWDGLYKMLEASNLSGKSELVEALKNAPDDAQRKAIMYRSAHYPYIKANILPVLRLTLCDIFFTKKTVQW